MKNLVATFLTEDAIFKEISNGLVHLLLSISNCVSSLSTMQSSSRMDGKMVNFCWKISLIVLFLVVCWMELLGEWAAMESDESKQSTFAADFFFVVKIAKAPSGSWGNNWTFHPNWYAHPEKTNVYFQWHGWMIWYTAQNLEILDDQLVEDTLHSIKSSRCDFAVQVPSLGL